MTTAHDILQAAAGHLKDRAATYDKPAGERSIGATVAAFKAVTGISMTEEQGWLFLAMLKAVRSQQGEYRADSYEDGAAYFALAGEAASVERLTPEQTSEALREIVAGTYDDGWVEHDGSNQPRCGPKALVLVRYKSGGETAVPCEAMYFRWENVGLGNDIAAYKVVK